VRGIDAEGLLGEDLDLRETGGKWKQGKGDETGHGRRRVRRCVQRIRESTLRGKESSRDESKRKGFTTTVKANKGGGQAIDHGLAPDKEEREV